MIKSYTFDFTTDTDGSATETKVFPGKVDTISVDYGTAVSGTDLTVTGYNGGPSFTVFSNTDTNTDFSVRPEVLLQDNTGSDIDLSDGQGGNTAKYGKYGVTALKCTIAQGGSEKTVKVTIMVEI